mmetsp:Transcript_70472/g.153068  ORF Transcript_70472/g.153068 Transcript_70472/m.153068 type:complete len:206 (-) Transcript_70472:342-959(-)
MQHASRQRCGTFRQERDGADPEESPEADLQVIHPFVLALGLEYLLIADVGQRRNERGKEYERHPIPDAARSCNGARSGHGNVRGLTDLHKHSPDHEHGDGDQLLHRQPLVDKDVHEDSREDDLCLRQDLVGFRTQDCQRIKVKEVVHGIGQRQPSVAEGLPCNSLRQDRPKLTEATEEGANSGNVERQLHHLGHERGCIPRVGAM